MQVAETAVLIGTRKGLFVARANPKREQFALEGPYLAGYEIQRAFLDPRHGGMVGYASAHHPVRGIHVYRSTDAGRSWHALAEVPRHGGGDTSDSLRTIWSLAPGPSESPDTVYAGIAPPGLFVSIDRGESWRRLDAFHTQPAAERWHPAKKGSAVHSIHVHGQRIYCALAAEGVYRSDDAGLSWQPCNAGVLPPNLAQPEPVADHNDHTLRMHPYTPDRLYRQSHTGTWRSDDGGHSWIDITEGLPSDFGYALAIDARDANVLYTIPEDPSDFRATVDGRLRVYRTRDAGEHWEALTEGLPQRHCYVTVLRDGLASDGLDPLGLYFGTSSGHVFHSRDRGDHWSPLPAILPPVLSIDACAVAQ